MFKRYMIIFFFNEEWTELRKMLRHGDDAVVSQKLSQ